MERNKMMTQLFGFNAFITMSVCIALLPLFLPTDAQAKTSQDLVMQTRQCFANARGDVLKEQQCREAYLATKRSTNAETLQKIKQSESYQQGADKQRQFITGSQQ
jgi:hypothetical protein